MTWCLFLYLYVDERTNERMKGRRGRGCWLVCGFVGGWLLRCRKSAKTVFQKSELASLKQRTFEKQRRFPPAKNQLPSCRVVANRHPSPRRPPSAIHHPPSTTKKSAPQPIQPAKNALLISISLQSYTIACDQHTIPYDCIKYNS